MITHLTRSEICEEKIHISHLYQYVSAYVNSEEEWKDLANMLEEALKVAKATVEVQIVDKDGECCFHVTPAGYIILMLPWKTYRILEEEK